MIFEKSGERRIRVVAKCAPEPWENRWRGARTVGELRENVGGSKELWEVGAAQRTVGEPWGLHREPWENRGDCTENRGRTVGIWGLKTNDLVVAQNQNRGRTVGIDQRTVGEPWGLTKEPWENRGD